jgi:hypothetical protein
MFARRGYSSEISDLFNKYTTFITHKNRMLHLLN